MFTAVLPLFAVCLWFALILFNTLVMDRHKLNWEVSIANKEAIIENEYSDVLRLNGELVHKTNALSNVIGLDIAPERVFQLTETLFPVPVDGVVIKGYGRDRDGKYNVTVTTASYRQMAEITRRFTSYDGIQDVLLNNAQVSSDEGSAPLTDLEADRRVEGRISFNFVEIDDDVAVNDLIQQ
ncbi:MAG: hypothetical protein TR69_WS6001000575 [candidate division WS6 bacterium OLB20]|uniref:Fimbrial assembly protein (PilN) n=1 Tax=candidate division WS6 bacterium OLB20 TaxID=1617426 RepID=A0A136LY43_9BACT|nr:MAG: hypothetical protein TR69_WS6001000575 [candidate division WS6 bacterium OLB20]